MPVPIHLVKDVEFNNSILDKEVAPSSVSKLKQGPLSASYVAIMMNEFTRTFRMAAFPLLGVLTLVGTFLSFREKIRNRKSPNGSYLFNLGMMGLFGIAELAALTLGFMAALIGIPAALLIVGPIIFTVVSGFNFFRSIGEFFYHAVNAIRLRFNGDNFSAEYQDHIKGLKASAFGTLINSIALLATLTTMLAPYVPAIGAFFGATATLVFQIGAASVLGVGFFATMKDVIKKGINKLMSKSEEAPEPVKVRSVEGKNVNNDYLSPGKFSTLDSHVEDLQIKMQVLYAQDETAERSLRIDQYGSTNLMKNLIAEEVERLRHLDNDHVKKEVLFQISRAIANPHHEHDALKKMVKEPAYQKALTSYMTKDGNGGLQKVLVLANQYCNFFPNPLKANEKAQLKAKTDVHNSKERQVL